VPLPGAGTYLAWEKSGRSAPPHWTGEERGSLLHVFAPDRTCWLETPVMSSVTRLTSSSVTTLGLGPDPEEGIVLPAEAAHVPPGLPGERR